MRNTKSIEQQILERGYARRALTPAEFEALEKSYDVRVFSAVYQNGRKICTIRKSK
jgi:hypothetical protein